MILTIGTTPALARVMVFPRVEIGDVSRTSDVRVNAAGKAINAARVVRTLGENVCCSGFVGGDTGRRICDELDSLRIAHSFVETGNPTRVCVTVIDRAAKTTTELVEEATAVSESGWAMLHDNLAELIPAASVVVVSGSIAPNGPVDHYAKCAELANAHHVPVILDGKGPALLAALEHRPTVVKPNARELLETLGATGNSDRDLLSAMRELCRRGAGWVVVTCGGDGAIAASATEAIRLAIPKIDVVSPIGSGDSFAGGLAVGLRRKMSVADACALGAACGCANAMSEGAGFVDPAIVDQLLSQIRVSPLA